MKAATTYARDNHKLSAII